MGFIPPFLHTPIYLLFSHAYEVSHKLPVLGLHNRPATLPARPGAGTIPRHLAATFCDQPRKPPPRPEMFGNGDRCGWLGVISQECNECWHVFNLEFREACFPVVDSEHIHMEEVRYVFLQQSSLLKIARTIADLASSENLVKPHLLEAIG
jgi:hypothetical protein